MLLRIALDQEALVLSFHVQPHSVHLVFLKSPSPSPPFLMLSSSFPSEHWRVDSFRLGPAFQRERWTVFTLPIRLPPPSPSSGICVPKKCERCLLFLLPPPTGGEWLLGILAILGFSLFSVLAKPSLADWRVGVGRGLLPPLFLNCALANECVCVHGQCVNEQRQWNKICCCVQVV